MLVALQVLETRFSAQNGSVALQASAFRKKFFPSTPKNEEPLFSHSFLIQ